MKLFAYCSGHMCGIKDECLRNHKHRKLLEKKIDTRGLRYVESTLCVKHKHNNFIPADTYAEKE